MLAATRAAGRGRRKLDQLRDGRRGARLRSMMRGRRRGRRRRGAAVASTNGRARCRRPRREPFARTESTSCAGSAGSSPSAAADAQPGRQRARRCGPTPRGRPTRTTRSSMRCANARCCSSGSRRSSARSSRSSALHEIFDQVVEAACELIGDDAGIVADARRGRSARTTVVASLGVSQEFLAARRRDATTRGSAPGRSQRARLVVVDKHTRPARPPGPRASGRPRACAPAWRRRVFERGEVVGSLGIASRDPNRAYSTRDQQVLLALAEHASLALNHARALDDVAHEAFHDSLTGMPNRALFLDRIVARAGPRRRGAATPVGVLFVDLDDFKTINDSLGHGRRRRAPAPGRRAAAQACLRPSDTIARLGGDEFAVLLEEVDDAGDAARAADASSRRSPHPFAVAGREVFVNGSVGIALGARGRRDPAARCRPRDVPGEGRRQGPLPRRSSPACTPRSSSGSSSRSS